MSLAYLLLSVVGLLLVLNGFYPIRQEVLGVFSFFAGWGVNEVPIQSIVIGSAVSGVFIGFGALDHWEGWLGVGLTVVSFLGLARLAVIGVSATEVVLAALRDATGPKLGFATPLPAPQWNRWWRLTRAFPIRSRNIKAKRNIDYFGDRIHRHRLDIYSPREGVVGAPVMVYIHGGAWVVGDKREQGKPMLFELVALGWVCVSVNYRLSPKGTWPDHIVDCKKAIAWVKEHISEYGGDPSFVALSGGSAGGHLCALAALSAGDPAWQPGFEDADTSVDACVPFYGVMDMTGNLSGPSRYGPGLRRLLEDRVMKVKGPEHEDVFVKASPIARVHPDAPPFFVLHGSNDTLVPVEVARRFVAELRSVSKAPVLYAEMPNAQHAFDVLASLRCQATTAGVASFLDAVRVAQQMTSGANMAGSEEPSDLGSVAS